MSIYANLIALSLASASSPIPVDQAIGEGGSTPPQHQATESISKGSETPALPTASLRRAVANMATSKNPSLQMIEENLQLARDNIEAGQELNERNRIASERAMQQAAAFNKIKSDNARLSLLTPEDQKNLNDAYVSVLTEDRRKKAVAALEEEAIDKIREVAARDPVQAKVLLDNLQFGGAEQVHLDYLKKQELVASKRKAIEAAQNDRPWTPYLILLAVLVAFISATSLFRNVATEDRRQ